MALCWLLCVFLLAVLAFIMFYAFFLPEVSISMRYKVKMGLYYFLLLNYGLIVAVLSLFTPKKLSNYKYPMWLISKTGHIMGISYEVEQLEKLKKVKGSYVIISNHQSSIDLMGVGLVWPYECTIVAKKSLMFAGWFGFAAWLCGCIFVSRGRQSAREQMKLLAKRMGSKDETLRVWIFPEGTRHAGEDLGQFKKGSFHLAVQAEVPVIPVVFSNYSTFFSSDRRIFENGKVTVRVLDPISTEGKTAEDVDALTETIRNQMNEVYHEISDKSSSIDKSE